MLRKHFPWLALLVALIASGAAGLINQVVWQRGLKIFLGGSESISSMIVVLVFLGGLGVGSWIAGRQTSRQRDPLLTLALLELSLGVVNFGVRKLLATDISESVFAAQRFAQAVGLPLWATYAAGALIILALPCVLMGATMPLAAEAYQRCLDRGSSRKLGWLLFANTFGSVGGTVIGSGFLMPAYGHSASLFIAAALNLLAGLVVLWLRSRRSRGAPANRGGQIAAIAGGCARTPSYFNWLSLALGFCALGYEMLLFRIIALRHEPLPFTFAAVLTGFLLFWSIGAALSSRERGLSLSTTMRLCGLLIAAVIPVFALDRPSPVTGLGSLLWFVSSRWYYFAPCILFGYLFGRVAAAAAQSWGKDIGRLYAFNTVGSCAGVVVMTLLGYEIPFFMVALALALLMFALHEAEAARSERLRSRRYWIPAAGASVAMLLSFVVDLSGIPLGLRMFYSRDGVIAVDKKGNLIWDGLWHSRLSSNNDHIGSANWYLGIAPIVAHPGQVKDALVIGVAAGVTATTIAKSGAMVEAYDINPGLRDLYERYPEGTLRIAENRAISIRWQDARTGLALNDKQYDVIQTQPLYLKQAGSSLLNSEQFYRLVSRRLKPYGIFCLYSNGTPAQALVVRQTAAKVFPHHRSFMQGYLLLLSNDPFDLNEESLRARFARSGPFWDEVRAFPRTSNPSAFLELFDSPTFPWGRGDLVTTDDHPIVEYPNYVDARARELGHTDLPAPGIVR